MKPKKKGKEAMARWQMRENQWVLGEHGTLGKIYPAHVVSIIITLLIATTLIIIIERCSLLGDQPATCCLLVCHETCCPHQNQNQRSDLELPTWFACTWWEALLFLSGYKALTNRIYGMGHMLWRYGLLWRKTWTGSRSEEWQLQAVRCFCREEWAAW